MAAAPALVTDEADFWFDASTLEQAAGTELDTWADVRGGNYPSLSAYTSTKPQVIEIADGALAGKKAVTFFTVGTQCDMRFPSTREVKTVFFVVDADQDQFAFLLGGPSDGEAPRNYGFHRDPGGTYRYHDNIASVAYWNDGAPIADPQRTKMPVGYQLITWSWDLSAQVAQMCSDRGIANRIGGKRLCEVVAFARSLDIAERSIVEGYLKAKWWPGSASESTAATLMLGRKAQVHFDAATESSFHFDVEGAAAAVSRWDDLSGNGNDFTPSVAYGSNSGIHYGTVGAVAGKPVFDSGAAGSGIDLALRTRITNTRSVVMVAEVDRGINTFWLGDVSTFRFHRGGGGEFAYSGHGDVHIATRARLWQNGEQVVNPTGQYPELPGGLALYSFVVASNCEWGRLGQDRTSANRNGGKRVAELFAFSGELSDEDRTGIEKLLAEKWSPAEEYVDALIAAAPVHVDASSPGNFNYSGGAIVGWKNMGSGADLVKPSTIYKANNARTCNPGSYGYTNGVPAFLMGPHGSYIDMYFTRMPNVRTVFWAMDIVRDKDAFFLADGKNEVVQNASAYHFHRGYTGGETGCYSPNGTAAPGYRQGPMYCDGGIVPCMWAERPPYGTHVFDVTSFEDLTASSISADRDCNDRNGGRAISELLILTTPVSGLTRKMIRERIEKKWTRSCGWAGAGDAEWGEGKYRVFNSDAAVPAEGAVADGVGFTASAELSGGTLAPGGAGIFASENVEARISAPIAGRLGVYGPGTVALQNKIETLDAISIGYGATLSLPPGGVVTGALSIHDKGRLVLDVSNLAEKEHAVIKFGGVSLLMGGTLYDYVSLSGGGDHFFSVSADGTEIHVNSPNVARSAVWTAAEDEAPSNPANWVCRNLNGDVVEGVLPSVVTTSVVFDADCDLRILGSVRFAEGVTFDLNGHSVKIAGFADQGYSISSVSNASDGATAELHVDVAEGLLLTNSAVAISGNVKLVKEGKGTFVAEKVQQTYTGGTDVAAGTFTVSPQRHYSPVRWVLGARSSTITVRREALFRLNGLYGEADADYKFVLDGGTLEGCGSDLPIDWGQLHSVTLTGDSRFVLNTNTGLVEGGSFKATTLDLGGHTLTVQIGTNGRYFYLKDATIKNGTLDVVSGGWLYLYKQYAAATEARDVDIRVGSALQVFTPVSVRNYEQVYGADNNVGEEALNVYGVFRPAAGHDYFYGCTMQDGSTIDLSGRKGTWSVKSAFSRGRNTVSFADGASVTLKLAGREDLREIAKSSSPYIVTWAVNGEGSAVLPPDGVRFQVDGETRQKAFSVCRDAVGLRLMYSCGTAIYLR